MILRASGVAPPFLPVEIDLAADPDRVVGVPVPVLEGRIVEHDEVLQADRGAAGVDGVAAPATPFWKLAKSFLITPGPDCE